jgi:hypothetical protein
LLSFDFNAIQVTPGFQSQLLGGLFLLDGAIKLLGELEVDDAEVIRRLISSRTFGRSEMSCSAVNSAVTAPTASCTAGSITRALKSMPIRRYTWLAISGSIYPYDN